MNNSLVNLTYIIAHSRNKNLDEGNSAIEK
jgi:hypothetical protein